MPIRCSLIYSVANFHKNISQSWNDINNIVKEMNIVTKTTSKILFKV